MICTSHKALRIMRELEIMRNLVTKLATLFTFKLIQNLIELHSRPYVSTSLVPGSAFIRDDLILTLHGPWMVCWAFVFMAQFHSGVPSFRPPPSCKSICYIRQSNIIKMLKKPDDLTKLINKAVWHNDRAFEHCCSL